MREAIIGQNQTWQNLSMLKSYSVCEVNKTENRKSSINLDLLSEMTSLLIIIYTN